MFDAQSDALSSTLAYVTCMCAHGSLFSSFFLRPRLLYVPIFRPVFLRLLLSGHFVRVYLIGKLIAESPFPSHPPVLRIDIGFLHAINSCPFPNSIATKSN
ncbi:hypothetical protein BDQ94DRAFT_144709 [Aspergillus welwitschiae]|uniref:Uncharacterized protein n=1 Tax=Aspergillus welwitschiae TaxID=1341132 RepID=A0A3F3Q0R8_9EURO|nr:hypothetical protein BDQ94DRAFT_144709 [Aspergillus welwitschiae]RDH32617.1 hypothetical protein BDQ94DRAFT_144709 [Aspergillus welwitschiae]